MKAGAESREITGADGKLQGEGARECFAAGNMAANLKDYRRHGQQAFWDTFHRCLIGQATSEPPR